MDYNIFINKMGMNCLQCKNIFEEENNNEILKERIAKAFKMEYEEFEKECKDDILHIENVRDISTKKMVFCIDMRIPYCVAYGLKVKNK